MGWVVRFSVGPVQAATGGGPPVDAEITLELLMSELWDMGTSGISQSAGGELVAGFESEADARTAAAIISARPATSGGLDIAGLRVEPVASVADWSNEKVATVIVDGKRQRMEFTIRAGGAFGHGAHPTTRLVLHQMQNLLDETGDGVDVLDVGTGTGVLAIAAAKAGAASVVAIDNDPEAVAVANDNVAHNRVPVECLNSTIDEVLVNRSKPFDLIVANVLLPAHRDLAASIVGAVSPAGLVITAGYLIEQVAAVTELYTDPARSTGRGRPRLETVAISSDGDWSSHRFRAGG